MSTFAQRSLARALASDRKRARKAQWRQLILPGNNLNLAAMAPYTELVRHGDGWLLRYYAPPRRGVRP